MTPAVARWPRRTSGVNWPDGSSRIDAAMAPLGGVHGTTLDAPRDKVAADLLTLSFDLAEGGCTAVAVGKYQADVSALRSYCA